MVTLRMQGLVREAHVAQAGLRDGVPPGDRAAFLSRVREAVLWAAECLEYHGCDEGALSSASRNALGILRRVAAMDADSLPAPQAGAQPAESVRLTRVVALLETVLGDLERGDAQPEALARAARLAAQTADRVEALCREKEKSPSALPPRTRRAYGMLRWLAAPEGLARYDAQVRRAVAAFAREQGETEGLADLAVRVRFEPGPRVYAVRRRADVVSWRLSAGFLAADEEALRDLAQVVIRRFAVGREVRGRHEEFVDGSDFAGAALEVELAGGQDPWRPRGRAHDLLRLFDRLNGSMFAGRLERPALHWAPTVSRRRLGHYIRARDLVCLNPLLDDPRVPEFLVEFVLYHELLHKKHGTRPGEGRRHSHSPEFRADERRHPSFDRAENLLSRLDDLWKSPVLRLDDA